MVADTTTFFLAFTTVFLGLAVLLWRMDRQARHLEDRVQALEAERRDAPAAKAKSGDEDAGREP